jgi:hypothetical protein
MSGPRPGLPAPPVRERRVLPALVVLLVLVVVVLGGYVTAAALSTPTGPPVEVAGIVRLRPLSGWETARRFDDPPGVRLTRGSASLDVVAFPFGGSSIDLLRAYVDTFLEEPAEQLSVSRVEPITLASGLPGARISYVGTFPGVAAPIEGRATAVVSGTGAGIVFDGWAPSGLLRYALDDVDAMTARAEVE